MQLKRFLLLHLLASLLLISWLFTPTRMLWDSFDHAAFHFLNGFVQKNSFWQTFWALASYKRSEWVMDIVRFVFFFHLIFSAPKQERIDRLAKILFLILFIFSAIMLIGKTLFPDILQIERFSPTATIEGSFRLSSVIDWIYVKDHSRASFPSDHGITACLFIGSMFTLFNWRYGLFAILTEGYYCLPRLVAGAHWLTDVVIGSATIALILCAWVYTTPVASLVIALFKKPFSKSRRSAPM